MADDGQEAVDAAFRFPPVAGATVLHVHTADDGTRFVVDDELLTAHRFAAQVAELGLPAGELVILVACRALAAARALADLLNGPVVAADAEVYTLPDGRVVARRAGCHRGRGCDPECDRG